jgi:hypothetical protein
VRIGRRLGRSDSSEPELSKRIRAPSEVISTVRFHCWHHSHYLRFGLVVGRDCAFVIAFILFRLRTCIKVHHKLEQVAARTSCVVYEARGRGICGSPLIVVKDGCESWWFKIHKWDY